MCFSYDDDLLFFSKYEAHRNKLTILLCESFVDLERKFNAAIFLGV